MAREAIFKTRNEKLTYALDFTSDKPVAASTISSVTAIAVSSDGTVVTSLLVGVLTSSGAIVSVPLKATTVNKETYTLTVSVTFNDSAGSIADRVVDVRVRDKDTVE